jgi:hypothetical protein
MYSLFCNILQRWRCALLTRLDPGPNPTTSIYNASVVKIYNAPNSLARFYNKNIFFSDLKHTPDYFNAGVVVVNLKAVGLAPEVDLNMHPRFGRNALGFLLHFHNFVFKIFTFSSF